MDSRKEAAAIQPINHPRRIEMAERNDNDRPWLHPELKEKSRYDPEQEMPDPEQVEKDIAEAERAYKDKNDKAA